MRDYLKLLRHLLQVNGEPWISTIPPELTMDVLSTAGIEVASPILKVESVRSLFTPALSEQASETLSNFIMMNGIQWSTALALTSTDYTEGRKKGSAFCTQSSYIPHSSY
jgi:hypothetical protein